jgi:hypothetical protein
VAWLLLRVVVGVVALCVGRGASVGALGLGAPTYLTARVPRGLFGLVLCSYRLFHGHQRYLQPNLRRRAVTDLWRIEKYFDRKHPTERHNPARISADNNGPNLWGCRGTGNEVGAVLCLGGREQTPFLQRAGPCGGKYSVNKTSLWLTDG